MEVNPLREPTKDEVRAQLLRIGDSKRFARAATSLKFLNKLCERSLEGIVSYEHELGVTVFGRQPDWVPLDDAIVRTGRFNLQRYLAEYYVGEGERDWVLLEVPNGTEYKARFTLNAQTIALGRLAHGFELTRRMFLGCGGNVVQEEPRGPWVVRDREIWPEIELDEALRVWGPKANQEPLIGKADAKLTRLLFSASLSHRLYETFDEIEKLVALGYRSWRVDVLLAAGNAYKHDWMQASEHLNKAESQKDPSEMDDLWSLLVRFVLDPQKAVLASERRTQRKRDPWEQVILGLLLYFLKKYHDAEEALIEAEITRGVYPLFMLNFVRGCTELALGEFKAAYRNFQECAIVWDVGGFAAMALMGNKQKEDAARISSCTLNSSNSSRFQKAVAMLALGDKDAAAQFLTQAAEAKEPWVWFIHHWPILESLEDNEEFRRLKAEMKEQIGD